MIATIDIKVNAAHPNIPLAPLYAFKGSPSSVRVLNVPQRVGKWQIDAVSVTVAMPDNSSTTVPAVAVCGCWVATLPSCDETGYCASGLQITANGTDENGAVVSGYCLGVGDVTILPRDATAVSNGTRYYLHYVAEQPENPNPGDMCYVDGVLKWYDGTAWQTFADGGASIDVVPPSTDPADAGKAADAKATGDALEGKRGKDDLALYKKVGVGDTWTLVATQSGYEGITTTVTGVFSGDEPAHWGFYLDGEGVAGSFEAVDADSCEVQWTGGEEVGFSGIARRPFTYQPVTGDALAKTSQLPTTPADIGAATAAQGAKAETAVQPSALAGAVRYDLGEAITPSADVDAYLPTDAFPVNVDGTDYATATILKGESYFFASVDGRDDVYAWNLQGEPVGSPAGATITFGAYQTPPSLTIVPFSAVTLADRAANRVAITAAIDELRLTFPAAVSGKVRDFGLRVEVGDGTAALAAPALVPVAASSETVTLENSDGAIPALADGTDTATGVTLLYFSETSPGKFLVKGEEAKEVA